MATTPQAGPAMARVVRWVLRQLGFAYFRITVRGLAHLPAGGPAILAGNHPNLLDGVLLLIVSPRPVRFLVAEELFFHRYLHWAFAGMGCIPVYRTRSRNGDALQAAVAALERGDVIGIFPEGTTAEGGRMRTVKRGVGLLALRTGAPVIPFGVEGSAAAYPPGTRVPRPGPLTLAFAPAVRYARTSADPVPDQRLQEVLADIRWEILRAMRWARETHEAAPRAWALKPLQVGLAGMVIAPLATFLTFTANPNLDPLRHAQEA